MKKRRCPTQLLLRVLASIPAYILYKHMSFTSPFSERHNSVYVEISLSETFAMYAGRRSRLYVVIRKREFKNIPSYDFHIFEIML